MRTRKRLDTLQRSVDHLIELLAEDMADRGGEERYLRDSAIDLAEEVGRLEEENRHLREASLNGQLQIEGN